MKKLTYFRGALFEFPYTNVETIAIEMGLVFLNLDNLIGAESINANGRECTKLIFMGDTTYIIDFSLEIFIKMTDH